MVTITPENQRVAERLANAVPNVPSYIAINNLRDGIAAALQAKDDAAKGLPWALRKAAKQFEFYADEHRKAGKIEKAATNQHYADMCNEFLFSRTTSDDLIAAKASTRSRDDGWLMRSWITSILYFIAFLITAVLFLLLAQHPWFWLISYTIIHIFWIHATITSEELNGRPFFR